MDTMDNYTWEYIQKHPKETKRLLGINYEQLRGLIEQGKFLHQRKQEEIEKRKLELSKQEEGIILNSLRKNRLF